jgi:uncharacterized cupredoxin-like copper-binding protein
MGPVLESELLGRLPEYGDYEARAHSVTVLLTAVRKETLNVNHVVTRIVFVGALLLSVLVVSFHQASAHQEVAHPAHIHNGTCDTLGDVVAPLNDVAPPTPFDETAATPVGGMAMVMAGNPIETDFSITVVKMSFADLMSGKYSINVHRSADDSSNYIACGEIGGTMMGNADFAVALRERGNSRESGVALLHDNGDGATTVTLMLVQNPTTAAAPAAPAPDGAVNVTATDMKIAADATTFKVGVPYTFVTTNLGAAIHELVIEHSGDVDVPLAEAGDIIPGSTATLPFTFTAPGKYQLACHEPGHYEAGMVLQIEVIA